MNKLQKKAISVIATAATLVYTAAPALAVTIEITGNNTDSTNQAYVDMDNSTYVEQSNNASITNDVDAYASSGGNEIEETTGGEASIETGDATTDVTVVNTVNSNEASVEGCCAQDVDVLISENNSNSYNKVDLDLNTEDGGVALFQDNHAKVSNHVDADSSTGKNEIEETTAGEISIETGDASSTVAIATSANGNSAVLSGDHGDGGMISLKILNNNTDTKNKIYLDVDRSVYLAQDNRGYVHNDVDATAKTGGNEIEEAAGGIATIETGDADATVMVDNMVNFNFADVDCEGCLWDVHAKIAENNSDTYNKIKADLDDELAVFQDNCGPYQMGPMPKFGFLFGEMFGFGGHHKCGVDNHLDAYAKTGWNEAEEVAGSYDGDPSIETGDAATTVSVGNYGNGNFYGEAPEWDWEMPYGFNLNLTLDLSELLAFLHLG